MKVYGLSGKSGTGKSYNATELCGKRGISALIDDGLFIYESSLVVGKSAKKQPTKVGAIKTALFTDDDHCNEVRDVIARVKPESILVLGTSDEMVRRIAARLELPEPCEYIHIEDITTPEQREKAERSREKGGMHVIPAPTFKVRKQFSGYFLNTKKSFGNSGQRSIEKTVVRPTYSYMGEYNISEKVISDIVGHIAEITPGVDRVLWTATESNDEGIYIRSIIQVKKHCRMQTTALDVQTGIYNAVSTMTAFNILGVEVEVRSFA